MLQVVGALFGRVPDHQASVEPAERRKLEAAERRASAHDDASSRRNRGQAGEVV